MSANNLKNRIAELEQCLQNNHSESSIVPALQAELAKAWKELEQLEQNITFERDTFDLREYDFNTVHHE